MTWLSAIIMGLVQGIAEFLPSSSSEMCIRDSFRTPLK